MTAPTTNETTTATTTAEIPSWALDPITGQIMRCPVQVRGSCECSLDRHTCLTWFDEGNTTCPCCAGPLNSLSARINKELATRIEQEVLRKPSVTSTPSDDDEESTTSSCSSSSCASADVVSPKLSLNKKQRRQRKDCSCEFTDSTVDADGSLASIDEETPVSFTSSCRSTSSSTTTTTTTTTSKGQTRRKPQYTISNSKNTSNTSSSNNKSLGSLVNKFKDKMKLKVTARKHKVPILRTTSKQQ